MGLPPLLCLYRKLLNILCPKPWYIPSYSLVCLTTPLLAPTPSHPLFRPKFLCFDLGHQMQRYRDQFVPVNSYSSSGIINQYLDILQNMQLLSYRLKRVYWFCFFSFKTHLVNYQFYSRFRSVILSCSSVKLKIISKLLRRDDFKIQCNFNWVINHVQINLLFYTY